MVRGRRGRRLIGRWESERIRIAEVQGTVSVKEMERLIEGRTKEQLNEKKNARFHTVSPGVKHLLNERLEHANTALERIQCETEDSVRNVGYRLDNVRTLTTLAHPPTKCVPRSHRIGGDACKLAKSSPTAPPHRI